MILEDNSTPKQHQPEFGNLFQIKGTQSADPLAFIRNNLKGPQTPVAETPVQETPVSTSAAGSEAAATTEHASGPVSGSGEGTTTKGEFDLPIESPEVSEADELGEIDESEIDTDDPVDPAQINFKNLRTKFRSEKNEHEKTRELLASVQAELEEYKAGKKLPETVQSQEEELTKLRRFQKIFDVKSLPEYQEKLAKPLQENGSKLSQVFAEYEIPGEYLDRLRGMKTLAQQNEFISEHFDSVGGVQVRQLLDAEKELIGKIQQVEKEPEAEMQRLVAEGARAREIKRKAEREVIQAELSSGWARSLDKIKKDGVFIELIHKANDKQYNENVVTPILRGASQEASKFIAMLYEDGLSRLRPEVAEFIANMTLLGHSSAINATSRQRAIEYAKTLEKNRERTNLIQRPRIGAATGAVGAPEKPRAPMTPATLGGAILNKIGVSK